MKSIKASSTPKVKIAETKWMVRGSLKNSWKSLLVKHGGGHEKM